MGKFQVGNKGGGRRKEKLFYDALILEIKSTDNPYTLRLIAGKMLELAALGDIQAIKEVANRLDGMPTVQVDQTLETITYVAALPEVSENADEWLKNNQTKNPAIQ